MNTEDLIHNLSLAASAVSKVLTQAGLKHAFISGYAVSRLVGGGERRPTEVYHTYTLSIYHFSLCRVDVLSNYVCM